MKSAILYRKIAVGLTILGCLVAATLVEGQVRRQAPNAALQARERMLGNFRRQGTVGRGYRPYTAWTYQQNVQTHTQALQAYGERCEQPEPTAAKEHLAEIRRNLDLLQDELDKFGEEAAKETAVEEQIAAIRKHYADALSTCDMLEKTITDDKVDTKPLCAHCAGLKDQLDDANTEFKQLMEDLGIELPTAEEPESDQPAEKDEKP